MVKIKQGLVVAMVVGILSWCAGTGAQEVKLPLDKLPAAVKAAVQKRFPNAELVGAAKETDGGKTEYEVSLKDEGKKIDVMLTPDGKITVIEKEITARQLPKNVRKAVNKKYPKAVFKRVEEVIKVKGDTEMLDFYEIQLQTADKKNHEVKVSPDGRIQGGDQAGDKEGGNTSRGPIDDWTTTFAVDKEDLMSTGRNPYFVLEPGHVLVLEGGDVQMTVSVLDETKIVDGVDCRIVVENEMKAGKVVEKSRNYFAISKRTNSVFYFGEDVGGAWLSGEKGARFGLMMPGLPLMKAKYYQEIAPGVAMDRAEIVSVSETVNTPAGELKNCIKIEETTPLEPGNKEYKYYAPGIGLVKEGSLLLLRYGKN